MHIQISCEKDDHFQNRQHLPTPKGAIASNVDVVNAPVPLLLGLDRLTYLLTLLQLPLVEVLVLLVIEDSGT